MCAKKMPIANIRINLLYPCICDICVDLILAEVIIAQTHERQSNEINSYENHHNASTSVQKPRNNIGDFRQPFCCVLSAIHIMPRNAFYANSGSLKRRPLLKTSQCN